MPPSEPKSIILGTAVSGEEDETVIGLGAEQPAISNRSFPGRIWSRTLLPSAAASSLVAALIHLWAMPEHLAAWWGYGAFFIATALGQGLYGVALLRRPAKPLLLVGIAGNLAIVAFYLAVHTDGMPYFGPLAGEVPPANSLGVVCVAVELALVLMLAAQAGVLSPARSYVAFGAAQAFGVGLILHLLHAPLHEAHGPDPLFHWLSDSALALPFSVLAVWAASPVARGIIAWSGLQATGQAGTSSPRLAWALTAAAVYAAASVPAGGLAARHPEADAFSTQASRDAGVTLAVGLLLLLAVAMARGAPWEELKAIDLWRPRVAVVAAGAVTGLAAVLGPTALEGLLVSPAVAQQTAGQCNATTYDRSYDVASIDVEIPYNRWGKSDPDGQVFVLQGDKLAVKSWHEQLGATPAGDPAGAGNRRLRPRPLILRANAGECVKIDFTNELDDIGGDGLPNEPRASMKVFGLAYDAQASDGSAVGYNADTTVPNRDDPATPKQENSISYYWKAPQQEGAYHFRDQGASAGSEADGGSTSHGLYGAFVVEPAGSDWTDPETGDPLYEGSTPADHERVSKESGDPYIDADVKPAQGAAFRETVQISQDELPGGNGFAFNYGAEPGSNRIADNPAGNGIAGQAVPDGIGEETSLSSWAYGDPALVKLASGKGPWLPEPDPDKPGDRISAEDCGLEEEPGGSCYVSNVTHAYPGDPTKIRYAHAGVKETHVFHMHAHQWLAEPNDTGDSGAPAGEITDANRPDSTTIDSQTYGPGESFTADLLYGAGSKPGTFGDSIFHCHLYPHFADGFWALFRVHDVREDGSGETPDGIKVRNLEPLSQAPPQPTADNPGYPRFIPGKFGWRAPQPPGGLMEPSDQPDDPNTLEREDLQPATRVVAGKPLDATLDLTDPIEKELAGKLAVEGDVQDLDVAPKPGAPFADPCPTGAREVTYNVSVIQADVVYNEDGWHDTQGRILVPDKDVEDVLAGREQPEPLFIRVNAGDCVNFNLTNRLPNWFGNDAFVELTQTNMAGEHIHLVKFDVLGSDGSSNGWNYQQAAFSKEQADFNKDLDAEGNVKDCDADGCRVPDPATWDPSTQSASNTVGQTISERWYADYELRTVFTHDHHFPAVDQNRGLFGALLVEPGGMDFRDPGTGEFFQPVNSDANGASCGDSCEGTAAGTAMDVIGPGANDDFREFGLAIQDFVSLTKAGGDPASKADTINPPNEPETFPNDDPGTMAINYRNAPFVLRQEKNGNATNPAHVFSSTVHGDPKTPILEAYSEDPVRIRTIQGSQEEQHVMSVHGMRWREEPDDPQSPLINSKAIGISEAFNFEVPRMTCGPGDTACTGDYLYGGTATDDMYLGAWGLLRARGERVPSLLPLPDNASPNEPTVANTPTATAPQPGGTPPGGVAPPEANAPGTPCPAGAPVKRYDVLAMQTRIEYNAAGDHDPFGLIYALAEDEAAVRAGTKEPEPLVLRANEGDCIEVRLTNKLTRAWLEGPGAHGSAGTNGDPTLPTEPGSGTPAGLRVSLHPQLVEYDVRGSDGTAVGFNRDQTVAPGDSRLYRWYADDPGRGEIGATNLTDLGDVRGHRHHGLFAGLNIEPKGSTYHDPQTGEAIRSGASADIRVPGAPDFREFTTFFQDGLNLRDADNEIIPDPLDHPPTPEEPSPALDAEDRGEKGFNYGNAPFVHRIGVIPADAGPEGHAMAGVFSSEVHGDPDTPIFRTFAGDRVRMRILQGSDKPRQHSFQVSGASWRAQPGDPGSTRIGAQGGVSVGRAFNLHLSPFDAAGDYRYGCAVGFHHLSGGLWGILRVYPQAPAASALAPTPIGNQDAPLAGGHPILPLEVRASATGLSLSASPSTLRPGAATTLSGRLTTSGGAPLADQPVTLWRRPSGTNGFDQVGGAQDTGANGNFSFTGVRPGRTTDYQVRFAGVPGAGLRASVGPTRRVTVR